MTVHDLAGQPVDPLANQHARAIVFVFLSADCPISNRYAPELRRLQEKFAPLGVRFWLGAFLVRFLGGYHLADFGLWWRR